MSSIADEMTSARNQLRRRRNLRLGGILALVIGAGAMASRKPVAEVGLVRQEEVTRTLALTGRVEPSTQASLSVPRSETVVELLVDRGARVKKGDLLARLDPAAAKARLDDASHRVQQAESSLELLTRRGAMQRIQQLERDVGIAEAEKKQLESDLKVQKDLLARGLSAQDSVETLQTRFTQATLRLESARLALDARRSAQPEDARSGQAQLESARSQLRTAELELAQLELRAPFDGIVLERNLEVGTRPRAGDPLFVIQSLDTVRVVANLDELYLPQIKVGNTARIALDAAPEKQLEATVSALGPGVDPTQGTTRLELTFNTPPDETWRPGMTVDIDLLIETRPSALTVPRAGLRSADARTKVWVVSDGVIVEKPVTVIPWRSERVVVLDGLSDGEEVVLGPESLKPGRKVRTVAK
jgi:HlyD family secretion protein